MNVGEAVSSLVLIAVYTASFLLWGRALTRHGSAALDQLVSLRPREQPFWNASHFLFVFGGYIVIMSLLFQIAIGRIAMDNLSAPLTLNTLGGLLAVVGSILVLARYYPRAVERLGLIPSAADIRLGLFSAVMILPPTMLISGVMSSLVEYHHPVLDSLKAEPGFGLFITMLVSTALVTPFVEEYLFRVLLQGGLQSLADRQRGSVSSSDRPHDFSSSEPATETLDSRNPYASSLSERPIVDDPISPPHGNSFRPTSWWPIVVASLVFASLHLGQGAAPIPLFFLSLGLGFLYRQTGNITASFVVHAVLNFITLAVNFAQLVE